MCSCSTVLPWWQTQYVMITHVTYSDRLCWARKLDLIIRTVVTKYSATVSTMMLEKNITNIISRPYTKFSKCTIKFIKTYSTFCNWEFSFTVLTSCYLTILYPYILLYISPWQRHPCAYVLPSVLLGLLPSHLSSV